MACCLRNIGVVNALGSSVHQVWQRLIDGDQSGIIEKGGLLQERSVKVGAVVEELSDCPEALRRYDSRNTRLLFTALKQIETDVRLVVSRFGADRVGVVLGTSTSGIEEGERAVRSLSSSGHTHEGYHYCAQEIGAVAEVVAEFFHLGGPTYTVSTACSSSAKVFRSGRALLALGVCDAVIVGGADALCRLTVNGFNSLELLSPEVSNPFSARRSGLNIGEGACVFLMTKEEGGIQLLGVGESSDAHHISAPDPEARGAAAAITQALENAHCVAQDIAYVNLHGTGTLHNDAMEARAIYNVFGSQCYCSSTKPLTGHLLGASGATEVGICWMMLNQASENLALPPHRFDGNYDSSLPGLNLVESGKSLEISNRLRLLSNSFGFGGSNCAVVIGQGG